MIRSIALISATESVSIRVLETLAQAYQIQLTRDFCPAWAMPIPTVHAFADLSDVPRDAVPHVFFEHSDAPGALAYHDVTPDGRPYMRTFVSESDGFFSGVYPLSVSGSHEIVETLPNESVDLWVDLPQPRGPYVRVCKETADPVEDRSYPIEVDGMTVNVSDFVTPAWFRAGSLGPYSFLRSIGAPFTRTDAGYLILEDADGNVSQDFGNRMPNWRKAAKERGRRFAALQEKRRKQP